MVRILFVIYVIRNATQFLCFMCTARVCILRKSHFSVTCNRFSINQWECTWTDLQQKLSACNFKKWVFEYWFDATIFAWQKDKLQKFYPTMHFKYIWKILNWKKKLNEFHARFSFLCCRSFFIWFFFYGDDATILL